MTNICVVINIIIYYLQTPVCCESGQYTLDACGCCLTCAKDDGQKCGGPFRVEGRCAGGLRCLRKCGEDNKQSKQAGVELCQAQYS